MSLLWHSEVEYTSVADATASIARSETVIAKASRSRRSSLRDSVKTVVQNLSDYVARRTQPA